MKHITASDPEGRNLDLTRPFIRHINFKFPTDYHGATIPTVTQTALFTREADRDDEGHLTFTDWRSNSSYWASYPVPVMDGLTANVDEVPSENLDINHKPITEYTVTYEQSNAKNDPGTPVSDQQKPITENSTNSSETDPTNPTDSETENAGLLSGVDLLNQIKEKTAKQADGKGSVQNTSATTKPAVGVAAQADDPVEKIIMQVRQSEQPAASRSNIAKRNKQQPSSFNALTFEKYQPLALPANLVYLLKNSDNEQLLNSIAVIGRFDYTEHGYQLIPFTR